ncbi:hypothetical protein NEOKW01_0231 [Nematocida sp. AWRm80]|nr:hypothetical protein NEOKW01_0231 [Nematocida sp. AWRm80]
MNEERYAYEESKEGIGPEPYINTTVLNALIYEYLVKKNYTGSAKVFKVEGDVSGINITHGSSALLDWFVAFNDLYNVRSGRGKGYGIIGKIDTILGKHSQEYHREDRVIRPQPNNWYPKVKYPQRERPPVEPVVPQPRKEPIPKPQRESTPPGKKDGDLLNTILELDDCEYNGAQRIPVNRYKEPQPPANMLQMKEISTLKLHAHKITTMSVCHKRKILITGSVDASICVVDLTNPSDIIKFESHTMQISQVKIKDSQESPSPFLYFGSASLDREAKVYKVSKTEGKLEVSLFLHLKGHKSSVKAIDFGPTKIYTMGIDGELRIWNMDGSCLGAFALRKTVKMMVARSDTMIAICDINSVSLFNPETAMYIKDLSAKGAVATYKTPKSTLFVLTDSILIYDHHLYNHQTIPLPSDKIQSSCIIGNRLFLGGYQMIYEIFEKNIYTTHTHHGIVSIIEGTYINNRPILLTGTQTGEVKLWEVSERERRDTEYNLSPNNPSISTDRPLGRED